MEHPNLVVWFDDLEDAVTTAFALSDEQRATVKVLKAPRAHTWVMLARDTPTREVFRSCLADAIHRMAVPVASDCRVLKASEDDAIEEDTFDQAHGFITVDVDYVEEGSIEALRRELISDADDYAASDDTGWFYAITDGEYDAGDENF